jgi:hypothetical protein
MEIYNMYKPFKSSLNYYPKQNMSSPKEIDSPPSIFPRHHNFDVLDPKYMTGMQKYSK